MSQDGDCSRSSSVHSGGVSGGGSGDATGGGESRSAQPLQEQNKRIAVLKRFYKALSSGDVESVRGIVAPDLEWWFHGPPSQQHLMRMLTGADRVGSLTFKPARVSSLQCGLLLAEGFLSHPSSSKVVCWVHVFTITNGIVVGLREYFNTSVTVTSSFPGTLWQSQLKTATSMPGLIVAV